ncbi:hypothetical protein [Kineosporia succinea]|uniref:Cytochrome c-type biogenesis protein CcmH/NrfF n=1 Tax=Kineosporia succinea TaxID=84632 RepID=A0ABT9P2T5_9ACTN|nr:hypothetical protein [Kineosporia succinea]MDP9826400.1 cytochrome c-type biogenesis protein CcmH/NrfF [Kineosporia succinea]
MGILTDYLAFLGIVIVVGMPLTFFLAVSGGLLWGLMHRLPGWFFPVALVVCAVIFTVVLTASGRAVEDEMLAVLTELVTLNLVIAVPALLVGWGLWWYRRSTKRRAARARKTRKPDSVSAARLP